MKLSPTTELEQAKQQLREAGLTFPPLPDELAAQFQRFGAWWWGTREVDQAEMYFFGGIAGGDGIESPPPDYMALCHAGHGVNSYALNYHLLFRPLALILQVGWGGVYMDQADQAALFQLHCDLSAGLVELATRVRQAQAVTTDVALVRYSELHDVCRFDVLDAADLFVGSRPPDETSGTRAAPPEETYERARAWLVTQM
jgi:hypothetical protein